MAVSANVDLRRRSADMKDQVPFAVCVHVEGAVQLIDRRATEPAVEDRKRFAHALPPGMSLLFRSAFNIRGGNARVAAKFTSALLTFRDWAIADRAESGQAECEVAAPRKFSQIPDS